MVDIQDIESHLGAHFCLVFGCSDDSEVGGGHESCLNLSKGHDRFVDVRGG